MSIDWNTYTYKDRTKRCSIKTHQKHWRMYVDEKRAPIPHLIWNDGHAEWSRWYWFSKEDAWRIGIGYYGFR